MKKKVLVLSSLVVFILIVGIVTLFYSDDDKVILESSKSNTIVRSNAITMMYETGYKTGEYQVTSDNTWPGTDTYTFNVELSRCENGSKIYWNSETEKVMMEATTADKCYVYFDANPVTIASYIVNNVYTGTDGDNGLYYHDGTGSYTNSNQEAGDNSYRYSGTNPNNYVCFDSDEETCPEDNLYRIIGVFDNQVKLIKNIHNGEFEWSGYSILGDPLITISDEWLIYIVNANWFKLANTTDNLYYGTVKTAYENEIGNRSTESSVVSQFSAMYVSDYGYGASPENWTTELRNYSNAIDSNWLYSNNIEWTAPYSDATYAFLINADGGVATGLVFNSHQFRPCFYLQQWTLYSVGNGTQENPYRISAPENLIEFTIGDTTYYAEEGMTWGEWTNSYYNVENFYFSSLSSAICITAGCVYADDYVGYNDIIIENENYILSKEHQGGTN